MRQGLGSFAQVCPHHGPSPDRIEPVVRLGHLRAIIFGDVLRGLVARTIAPQIANQVGGGHCSFQCALKTLQHLADLDRRATVVSVDGIGAFDFVSRNAML